MPPRVAFLTIGQTPRDDVVPEIASWLPGPPEIEEVGALDGMSLEEVCALAPGPDGDPLISRMRDGTQVRLRAEWVHERVTAMVDVLDPDRYAAALLLCTGRFPDLSGRVPILKAGPVLDHGVEAICDGMRRMGLLLPLEEQVGRVCLPPAPGREVVTSWASPYEGDRFAEAAEELAGCDVVVMHCMGYTEAHRRAVAAATGRPVLLARRLAAAALAQLL